MFTLDRYNGSLMPILGGLWTSSNKMNILWWDSREVTGYRGLLLTGVTPDRFYLFCLRLGGVDTSIFCVNLGS